MAKSNFKKISIKDTEGGNFGNYEEGKGGGTPRGGVWGGKSGRVGWDERDKSGELPQGAHREEQPRTKDGKFTYNSVNGKETKYESRGETVNPLLTGGKNGVKIEDAKKEFSDKSGSLYDQYKDKWYQKGSELIQKEGRKYKVSISANDIWEIARVSFNVQKGGFEYEAENFDKAKKGRRSNPELISIKEAKKNKGETFVTDAQGGIKMKAGSQPGQQLTTGLPVNVFWRKKVAPAPTMAMNPNAINQSISTPSQGTASNLIGQTTSTPHVFSKSIMSAIAGTAKQLKVNPVSISNNNNGQKPNVKIGGLGTFKKKV